MVNQPVLLWRRTLDLGESRTESGTAMSQAADGTVYAARSGYLFAHRPADGTEIWRTAFGGASRSTPAVSASGQLYWGADDSLDILSEGGEYRGGTGALTANYIFGSSPAIAPDGSVIFVHDALWAAAPDGTVQWAIPFAGPVHTNPALSADGVIYAGAWGALLAVDLNGDVRWRLQLPVSGSSPSIGPDGTVYIGTNTASLVAVAPDGTQRWEFRSDEYSFSGFQNMTAPPVIGLDGTIYVGSFVSGGTGTPTAHLYAVRTDGTLRWKYPIPKRGGSTGFITALTIDRDGRIYGCADNGLCYGFDADGQLLWEYALSSGIPSRTAPLLVADGIIWVLDGRGDLEIIADSSFPALQASPRALTQVAACDDGWTAEQTVQLSATIPDVRATATLSPTLGWATLITDSATLPSTAELRFSAAGLADGVHRTTLQIASDAPGLLNPQLEIPIELSVQCATFLRPRVYAPLLGR